MNLPAVPAIFVIVIALTQLLTLVALGGLAMAHRRLVMMCAENFISILEGRNRDLRERLAKLPRPPEKPKQPPN